MDNSYHYHNDTTLVVEISGGEGALVNADMKTFLKELVSLNKKPASVIAFDMSTKKYLNSSGLGDLIMIKDMLFDEGLDLVLMGVTKNIISLLEMVGADGFFTIHKTENDLDLG